MTSGYGVASGAAVAVKKRRLEAGATNDVDRTM